MARMSNWLVAALLGLIEGVTEFLPVSSTGHLLLAEHYLIRAGWLGQQPSELFNVVIQSGAVLAVLLVFTDRVRSLVAGWREPEARDYLLRLAVAFGVTGAGGLLLKKLGLKLPETPAPVAWATLVGGVLFLGLERWLRGRPATDRVTWGVALAVALAQLLAASFPGTSRSGATILVALALGLSRPAATEFSFLLGIPTLLAAGAKETLDALREGTPHEPWPMIAVALVVAAVSAFVVVRWLLGYVRTHTFEPFGWYRVALGVAILAFL